MFVELLNTSISASWLILAIMVIRVIFKRMPKAVNCVLWGLVAIRLICPFSIESSLSLIPSAETIPEEILYMEGAQQHDPVYFDGIVMPEVQETVGEVVGSTVSQVQTFDVLGTLVWLAGMAVMLLYVLVSYLRLRHRVMVSINERDNIWVCDRIDSPFILGIFRPRIYMPSNMEEAQAAYVIAHEQAHLNRRDHWWKPLGFFLLTVYWFNPLIWVAYILLSRDIELACDEKVVRSMEMADKQAYSEALLVCSVNRRMIAACPLAFGEVGVKARVKSVLNYKKPAFWVIVGSVIICVVVAVCFLTDPETDSEDVPETPCEHQPGEFVSYEWREAPDPDVPSDKIREQQWERYVCTKCGEEFEVEVASRLISGEKKEYPVREFLTEEDFEDPVATAIKLLSRAYSFDPAAYTPTVSQNGDFWNITFDWEHHYVVELTPKLPYPQTLYEFRRVPPGGYGEVEIPAEGELVEIAEEILWNAYALKGEDAQIEVVQGEDKICVQFVFSNTAIFHVRIHTGDLKPSGILFFNNMDTAEMAVKKMVEVQQEIEDKVVEPVVATPITQESTNRESTDDESGLPFENIVKGNPELILSRGGTLLPDDDPRSYVVVDDIAYKRFEAKGSTDTHAHLMIEYYVGNIDEVDEAFLPQMKDLVNGEYPKNSKGETYGNTSLFRYVGYLPDLIKAVGTNGESGYIYEPDKQNVPQNLPAEECPHAFMIPLYNSEHEQIGEFEMSCGGHFTGTGQTIDEVREQIRDGDME